MNGDAGFLILHVRILDKIDFIIPHSEKRAYAQVRVNIQESLDETGAGFPQFMAVTIINLSHLRRKYFFSFHDCTVFQRHWIKTHLSADRE